MCQSGGVFILLVLRIVFVLTIGVSLTLRADAVRAGVIDDAALLRIDTLTGQLGLANKAGKSVCFLMMGADRGLLEKAALTSITKFDASLSGLIHGAPQAGLDAESDTEISAQLTALQTLTRPVMLSARQIVAGDLHPVPMGMFLNGIDPLHHSLDDITVAMLGQFSSQQKSERSVILTQQQDALVQGLLRDACLLHVGILGDAGHARVLANIKLFEDNMDTLLKGRADLGIPAPPNTTIRVTLEKVAKQWTRIKPVIESTLRDEPVTMKQLQKVSIFGDLLGKYVVKMRGYYRKI